MFYHIGEYAYPGANFLLYSLGFAIIILAVVGAYAVWKAWQ